MCVFARIFEDQLTANKIKPHLMADLFDIKQAEGDPLKNYLNRFCEVSVRIQQQLNEDMKVDAFVKGLCANPFSESLLRNQAESMVEVRKCASTFIEAEEALRRKRDRRNVHASDIAEPSAKSLYVSWGTKVRTTIRSICRSLR